MATATTIDIDTGGTFTDAFLVRDGRTHAVKTLTTPHDLAVCFREVIARAAAAAGLDVRGLLRETAAVRYATTVGTNAVVQRTGPRLGLVAGRGGERLYDGDGRADRVFELFLAPDMVEVVEGASDGEDAVRGLLERCARALVCSLPGADRDADAERRAREAFERQYPKHCLDAVPLLLSHEVASDPDDFRRTATALFDAYVHGDVAGFLYRAEDHLRDNDYRRPLLAVHNDGGCARVARTIAARTYNSGPTAGLMGARAIAALYGLDPLVTLDMGGTSLDVAFLSGGEIPLREHGRVEGAEVSFPLPDLLVLGAGGGSIAHVADDGLRVGPRSAGAQPGPACFGFGGTEPTVTDADVVLGVIDPAGFLGGAMELDAGRAERALAELGAGLGTDAAGAAEAVRARIDADMGAALAQELSERGLDPAATTILAYGGAGPTHACGIADAAGIGTVLTVPFAAVFSAFGASSADVVHSYAEPAGDGVEERLRARALRDMRGEGFAPESIDVEAGRAERHGVEMTRVRARARLEHFGFASAGEVAEHSPDPSAARDVRWPGAGALRTSVYRAADLGPGATLAGPAIVEAPDTTHAIPPGWSLTVDEYGNSRLHKEGAAR